MKIVQVTSEAKARPIITALTTMSADMNIDHGDNSLEFGGWPRFSSLLALARRGGGVCGAATALPARLRRAWAGAMRSLRRGGRLLNRGRGCSDVMLCCADDGDRQRQHRQRRDRSQVVAREIDMTSYFGPVADEVVIDTGQFDRFGVVSPKPLHQGLDRGIEIEDQAAGVGIPYHALQPEKRRHPHTSRDRRDQMQTGRRIEHEIPGRAA